MNETQRDDIIDLMNSETRHKDTLNSIANTLNGLQYHDLTKEGKTIEDILFEARFVKLDGRYI